MKIKNMIAALLFVAAGLGANSVGAAFLTGQDLHELCSEADFMCSGYIMGVVDSDMPRVKRDNGEQCMPVGATGLQLTMVVDKWLNDNPQHLHNSASLLVRNALIDGFDCDTGQRWILR